MHFSLFCTRSGKMLPCESNIKPEITPLCLLELRRGVGGGGSNGFNKWSSCLQPRIFMKSFTSTYNTVRPIHSILDQVSPSGKLPTYASPNSTLTLSSHLGQNILVRGGVGGKLPKHLNWSVSAFFAVLLSTRTAKYQVKGQSALKFRADEVMDK